MAITRPTHSNSERDETDMMEQPKSKISAMPARLGIHDQAPSEDFVPSSAISELQAAIGPILLARKDPKEARLPKSLVYRWTGAFELFSFPRELRDRIYYFYLYRPKGIRYHRNSNSFPFEDENGIISLFLTCHQVYDEALPVFGRYNQVQLMGRSHWRHNDVYDKALHGALRLVPERPRSLLQRVNVMYKGSWFMREAARWTQHDHLPGEVFVQALRDGYLFKNTFPKLREFTITWQVRQTFFAIQENLEFENKTEDEKIQIWLLWMKRWVAQSNVVPPNWMRFELRDYWEGGAMREHAGAMNIAYTELAKELAPYRDEHAELRELAA